MLEGEKLNKNVFLVFIIFMLLASFGAASANNSNYKNNKTRFCCDTMDDPLIETQGPLNIQTAGLPSPQIEMSKVVEILKIFVLSSLLCFSFMMAKKGNIEF